MRGAACRHKALGPLCAIACQTSLYGDSARSNRVDGCLRGGALRLCAVFLAAIAVLALAECSNIGIWGLQHCGLHVEEWRQVLCKASKLGEYSRIDSSTYWLTLVACKAIRWKVEACQVQVGRWFV